MKLLKPKYVLRIEWIAEESPLDIAANGYITHPKNIKRRNHIHEDKLRILNDAAMSLSSMLEARHFILSRPPKQSSRSYSFYTHFYPVTDDGETLGKVEIVFRLSDHEQPKGAPKVAPDPISPIRIRIFLIGDEELEDVIAFTLKLGEILDKLKAGDYSVLVLR